MSNKTNHSCVRISGGLTHITQKMTAGRWAMVLLAGMMSQIGVSVAQEADTTAYIVLQYEVTDQAMYQEYIQGVRATQEGYQSTLLVSDSNTESVEGEAHAPRTVILSFPTAEQAMDWYNSDGYQAIVGKRLGSTSGVTTLVNARDPG